MNHQKIFYNAAIHFATQDKSGHEGLKYVHREGTHVVYENVLTTVEQEIYEFLGLRYDFESPYHRFHTLEEIFEFVASSDLFHPDIYLLENRNHTSRPRDRKRKTYMVFLEWCKSHLLFGTAYTKPNKEPWVMKALDQFGAMKYHNDMMEEYHVNQEVKKKLNGALVSEWTGLDGKELGLAMAVIKRHVSSELVLRLSEETVKMIVKDLLDEVLK